MRFYRSFYIFNILLFLFVCRNLFSQNESKTGKITGSIIERATQQPVIGAIVLIEGTQIGASSDLDGRFQIPKVIVGTYVLKVSCIGYKTVMLTDIVVRTGQPTQVRTLMDEVSILLGNEVTVQGSLFSIPKELTTSAYNLHYEEIRRQAGSLEDVHRLVQSIPGVVPTNDQRNDLVVRGGSPSENLTLIDNVEVPNISHFGTQGSSGGPISILNTEFIQDADFIAGGFPAQFGNKLSSVLNIKLREGNRDNLSGTLNLSTTGAGLILEGPLSDKGNFILSARRSWVDLIMKQLDISAIPVYSNYQIKAVYNLDQNNKIWIVSLGGIDRMDFKSDFKVTDDPSVMNVESGGNKLISGMNWLSFFGKKGYGVLGISNAVEKYIEKSTDPRENDRLNFENNSTEGETTFKYDLNYSFDRLIQINLGAITKFYHSHLVIKEPLGCQDQYSVDSTWRDPKMLDNNYYTTLFSSYIQFSKTFLDKIDLSGGLRYDYFGYAVNNNSTVSPRLSMRYNLTPTLSLNASYGIFYQMPALYLLSAVAENKNLKPIRSDHYVLGLAYFPRPDIKITVEGYYKYYSKYPVSRDHAFYSLANSGDDYSIADRLIPFISEGKGRSRGIEFYLQKRLIEDLYGQIRKQKIKL
jgi:hypothetical protein